MLDPNKTFVIYVSTGILIGFIIGLIMGFILGNFELWLSVISTIGALIGLAIFHYNKNKLG